MTNASNIIFVNIIFVRRPRQWQTKGGDKEKAKIKIKVGLLTEDKKDVFDFLLQKWVVP